MTDSERILERYFELKSRIDANSASPSGTRILPVTKTVAAERIICLRDAGVTAIGENRVQEALEKLPALENAFDVHVIGRLQTNKAGKAAEFAALIQSLDRWELACALDRAALLRERTLDVLVEVNIGRDPAKAGILPEDADDFLTRVGTLSNLRVRGLMTVAPITETAEGARPYFRAMKALFDRLKADSPGGARMEILSMGMSADCVVAAQEGATLVRVGSAIFGPRG